MRNTTLRTFTYTNPSCYPIEAALLREPNLWVPGKKPIGRVKIDWSNPLTRGLIYFVVPVVGKTLGNLPGLIDLVNPEKSIAYQGATTTPLDYASDDRGNLCLFKKATGTESNTHFLSDYDGFEGASQATIHSKFRSNSAAYSQRFFSAAGTNINDRSIWIGTVSGTLRCAYYSATYYGTRVNYVYTFNTTDFVNMSNIWYGGNSQRALIDGVELSVGSVDDADSATTIWATAKEYQITAHETYRDNYVLSHLLAFRVAKTDAELRALDLDPYQFLIPA